MGIDTPGTFVSKTESGRRSRIKGSNPEAAHLGSKHGEGELPGIEARRLDGFEAAKEVGQFRGQRRLKVKGLTCDGLREFELCRVEKVTAELQPLEF